MKILITGGAGFIGSNLAAFHAEKNDSVVVIDNLLTGSKKNIEQLLIDTRIEFIEKDICEIDIDSLPEFDLIYHLASPASPDKYKKYPVETLMVNSVGTKKMLDLALKNKNCIFFLASTSEVYGDPLVHPQVESYFGNVNTVGPRSCYDEAKRFAEAITTTYVNKFGLDARIARIFNTYGPNMEESDGRVISNFISQALSNKPLTVYGPGKQTRSFCYVSDLLDGIHSLATVKGLKGQIVNLGNPEEISIIDLAQIVTKMTKSSSKIEYKAIDADDPKKRKPDISKAGKLLNFSPKIKLREGLEKTIEYFKSRFI